MSTFHELRDMSGEDEREKDMRYKFFHDTRATAEYEWPNGAASVLVLWNTSLAKSRDIENDTYAWRASRRYIGELRDEKPTV